MRFVCFSVLLEPFPGIAKISSMQIIKYSIDFMDLYFMDLFIRFSVNPYHEYSFPPLGIFLWSPALVLIGLYALSETLF